MQGEKTLWSKDYAGSGNAVAESALEISESLKTDDLRSAEYALVVQLAGATAGEPAHRETIWICSPRANSEYFMGVRKALDENPLREEITTRWIREHNLNVNYYNGHQMVGIRDRFEPYVDLLVRNNLLMNANLSCVPLLAERDRTQEEALALPHGRMIKEGEKAMMASTAMVNIHADAIRDGHRIQAEYLRQLGNPIVRPSLQRRRELTTLTSHDSSPYPKATNPP